MAPSTVYINKRGWQPTCEAGDTTGEIKWTLKMKEPWHLKMYPVPYGGDFSDQWMWLVLYERGYGWDKEAL